MKSARFFTLIASAFTLPCLAAVRVESIPESGLQPEVAVAKDGTVHLVYLTGEPKAAEVRYTYRKPGEAWHPSQMVNSPKSTAIALGTIRGPQLAVGGMGTVHVIWNGTGAAASPRSPLWYARKSPEDKTFGQQQDLLGDATALDGGASITANESNGVFVVWHGNEAGGPSEEKQRLVLIRSSDDDGIGFGKAEAANRADPGVCACCSLRAMAGPEGIPNIFFRSAETMEHRAMTLLSLSGGTWKSREIEPWKIAACPMSSAALAFTSNRLLGAWETAGQIRMGWLSDPALPPVTVAAEKAKHPSIAINGKGSILVSWLQGSGWNRGGSVFWQEFDGELRPTGKAAHAGAVPAWGRVTAYSEPKGDFVVLR